MSTEEWRLKLKWKRGKVDAWAIGSNINFAFLGSFDDRKEANHAFEQFLTDNMNSNYG